MPELPEAETNRLLIEDYAIGKTIQAIFIESDPIVFDGQPVQLFKKNLSHHQILATGRHGKYFWIYLSSNYFLLIHLGMTGWTFVYPQQELRPKYTKLELKLNHNLFIGFNNRRKLGRITLHQDLSQTRIRHLGPDAYLELPSVQQLHNMFLNRKAPLKSLLLNQKFLAGIGNWIADEVLYQSSINPLRKAHDITIEEVKLIRKNLKHIIKTAIKHRADSEKLPPEWLFHYRWGKKAEAKTFYKEKIDFIEVGGRTTAWVKDKQR